MRRKENEKKLDRSQCHRKFLVEIIYVNVARTCRTKINWMCIIIQLNEIHQLHFSDVLCAICAHRCIHFVMYVNCERLFFSPGRHLIRSIFFFFPFVCARCMPFSFIVNAEISFIFAHSIHTHTQKLIIRYSSFCRHLFSVFFSSFFWARVSQWHCKNRLRLETLCMLHAYFNQALNNVKFISYLRMSSSFDPDDRCAPCSGFSFFSLFLLFMRLRMNLYCFFDAVLFMQNVQVVTWMAQSGQLLILFGGCLVTLDFRNINAAVLPCPFLI